MQKYIFSIITTLILSQQVNAQCTLWKVQRQGDGGAYADMQFIDTLHGWIGRSEAQSNAPLLRTTDGGKTWTPIDIVTTFGKITSVSFIDSLNGWAGAGWQMLRTWDGGKTWKIIHELPWIGFSPTFSKILFTDSLHGWGLGGDTIGVNASRVFKTTDGGKSWDIKQLIGINVYSISFVDTLQGWLAGNQILHTMDGGRTWEMQNYDSAQFGGIPTLRDIKFIDQFKGYAPVWADSKSWLLITSDGGKKWENYGLIDSSNSNLRVEKLSFINSLFGWTFGWMFFQGGLVEVIYKTTNGGKNWRQVSLNLSDQLRTGQAIDDCHIWALANDGTVITLDNTTNVKNIELLVPETVYLSQNYPNPFNPNTNIIYSLKKKEKILLTLFDISGKEIQSLVDEVKDFGIYTVQFNASKLSSGTYLYRMTTPTSTITKKMIVIK